MQFKITDDHKDATLSKVEHCQINRKSKLSKQIEQILDTHARYRSLKLLKPNNIGDEERDAFIKSPKDPTFLIMLIFEIM